MGPLAQLVEQLTLNQRVVGSIPTRPKSNYCSNVNLIAKVAKLVDALDLGSSGATRESSSLSFRTIQKYVGIKMQISIEQTSDLGRNIKIVIPATKINDIISNKIKTLTKQIKLNGFRPGHVPPKLINEKYGSDIRKEALNETIDSALNQAIADNNLSVIGDVELKEIKNEEEIINNSNINNDSNIECIFTVEVYPEIIFNNDLSNIQIITPKVEVTEQDIDTGVLHVRQQFGKKVNVENRAAKNGDFLTIDFEGFIENKEFPGSHDTDVIIEIGSGEFIDGFESGLIGVKLGEAINLKLQFPENYAEKTLAGKHVEFNVVVKKIEEQELAELNEDIAKSLNIPNNDINQIRSTIKSNLEKYIKQLIIDKERENLTEALLKNHSITIPNKLLIEEQRNLEITFKQRNKEQGINIKELNNETIDEIAEQAKKNVHLALLLREIIKINHLQIDENLLKSKLNEMSFLFQNKLSTTKYKNIYNNMKNSIINSMLTNVAIDFIMAKVTKIEQLLTFEELNKK